MPASNDVQGNNEAVSQQEREVKGADSKVPSEAFNSIQGVPNEGSEPFAIRRAPAVLICHPSSLPLFITLTGWEGIIRDRLNSAAIYTATCKAI